MDAVLCLLPSPLLGPACWRPVADVLADRGFAVALGGRGVGRAPRTGADALAAYLAAVPSDRDVVLVPHSNAGLFVPSLTAVRRVADYVFVDAGLPLDGADRVPMIPPEFYEMLAGKADSDGLLPPWTQWWDSVSELFPDAGTRAAVEREESRLPLSYFAETVPVPRGWADRRGAYLAFGDTYAAERAAAGALGWAVTTLPGDHLHMLVDPVGVASAIVDLIAGLPGMGFLCDLRRFRVRPFRCPMGSFRYGAGASLISTRSPRRVMTPRPGTG
jgi:hypothetical protein